MGGLVSIVSYSRLSLMIVQLQQLIVYVYSTSLDTDRVVSVLLVLGSPGSWAGAGAWDCREEDSLLCLVRRPRRGSAGSWPGLGSGLCWLWWARARLGGGVDVTDIL